MFLLKFLLIHYSILLILDKFSFRGKLAKFARYLGGKRFVKWLGKFLYWLVDCTFCYNHFGGVLVLPIWFVFIGFELEFLLFPLMSTGAIFLLDKQVD